MTRRSMTRTRTLPTVIAIAVILAALALLASCGTRQPLGEGLWLGVQEMEKM